MKKSLHLFLLLLLAGGFSGLFGQTLQQTGVSLQANPISMPGVSHSPQGIMTTTCGADTLQYAQAKATGLPAITLNASSSANTLGQYYDCPQSVTINGFSWYGWQTAGTGASVSITCAIYVAGTDSLPVGTPLASTTIAVDSNFYGGNLDLLRKNATFTSPVTVTVPYVVVVETSSSTSVAAVCNSWTALDGAQEWLGMAGIAGLGWLHGYDLNVGGGPFDCDVVLEPHVVTDLRASFNVQSNCHPYTDSVSFLNTTSPVFSNRMYSQAAFLGIPGAGCTWDFGDGATTSGAYDATHLYNGPGSYQVNLRDTLFGWNNTCIHDTTITLNTNPLGDFSFVQSGGNTVDFTALMVNASGYLWDFGDGNTSTTANPSHTYSAQGTYTVCLTVTNPCGTDSSCSTVSLSGCPAPQSAFTFSTTNLTANFTDGSTTGGNPGYLWDFGDGNTSTQASPAHTYSSGGNYTVCLTVTDSCGTDSSCQTVNVCQVPTAAFSFTSTDLDVTFTNNTMGNHSYSWDFGDGNTSTTASPQHSYGAAGTYVVCLTATNNCGSNTICDTVSVSLSGMMEALNGSVSLYPNPTSANLNFAIQLEQQDDLKIEVMDLPGRILRQVELQNVLQETSQLDLSNLQAGVYLVRISGSKGAVTRRIQLLK